MHETTRRYALALAATGLTGSLSGCASLTGAFDDSESSAEEPAQTTRNDTQTSDTTPENGTTSNGPEATDVDITEPDVFAAETPIPDAPADYEYATMSARSDAPVATVYGSWKCPYTREFVRTGLPELVAEFVASGDVALEFRSVAYDGDEPFLGEDAPRASRAGLAAWHVDPDAYWEYFEYVFANQPPEREAWAQPDALARFASEAGVEPTDQFEAEFTGSGHSDAVRAASTRFQELDADAVPRVVTSDSVTAPNLDVDATREQFRTLAARDD
ncbi:DsbA family protein [Halobacterium bonnevillei]|uniref:Thioredoxin domain-containing protein n=1 Tax=Halobacterium bonnevillei TaxID=2692200 RepID=A0A6B0SDT5_9EURY|nr:thioredoxin domain-containing protein [Halobacterium bonnevillei]MXR19578.1 thioredoxin domain-containing protein [Halobacterium bonnevillei]